MSAKVTIEETPTGWRVVVTDGEIVVVETDGPRCSVGLQPDNDDQPERPLAVTLS